MKERGKWMKWRKVGVVGFTIYLQRNVKYEALWQMNFMNGFRIVWPTFEWGAIIYVIENNGNRIPATKENAYYVSGGRKWQHLNYSHSILRIQFKSKYSSDIGKLKFESVNEREKKCAVCEGNCMQYGVAYRCERFQVLVRPYFSVEIRAILFRFKRNGITSKAPVLIWFESIHTIVPYTG